MRVTRFFGERDLGQLLDRLFSFKEFNVNFFRAYKRSFRTLMYYTLIHHPIALRFTQSYKKLSIDLTAGIRGCRGEK